MTVEITQAWLRANVGEPSGKWGSKYSEIFKLTGQLETKLAAGDADRKPLVEKLFNLVNAWSSSAHSGAVGKDAIRSKALQQRQLNVFRNKLQLDWTSLGNTAAFQEETVVGLDRSNDQYPKEMALVRGVVAGMKESAVPLLKNTGFGMSQVNMVMYFSSDSNGQYVNRTMRINPTLAYSPSILKGVLVHEYHHCLNDAGQDYLYLDEFVAWWKQFSVTHPAESEADRVAKVNRVLEKHYAGMYKRWPFQPVARLADVGDFLLANNAYKRDRNAVKHKCAPKPK